MIESDTILNLLNYNYIRLLDAKEVATIIKVAIKTVHKLARDGKLACVQITPRERRFTLEQIQQYIESQSTNIRVDRKGASTVSSRPKKGGDYRKRGEKTGVSKACLLDQLKEEMRQW